MDSGEANQMNREEVEALQNEIAALQVLNQTLRLQTENLQASLADAAANLQISDNQFRLMADNIPVIVWMAEADGNVTYFNKRWYDFTGQVENDAHGWGWQPVLHPDDLQRTLDVWTNSILTGSVYEIEYRFKKWGEEAYYWHLGKAIPVRDTEGNVIRWFGTCTNIHEQKEAGNRKDEFISIASHELKTPLTTVKAFLQMAGTVMAPENMASSFVSKATTQLGRLEKLIADLLDVSKINAGKLVYNIEEFDFQLALKETVGNIQQTVTQHNITFESDGDIRIKGDRLRLEQVVNNLLTNAIKYSPHANKIIVRSEVQQGNVVVSVQDFGIGIAPENLKNLFDRYYRVDNTSARFQGLGLGLFISSEIIKRHGGSFWIESEEGKGSTFYFLLPAGGHNRFEEWNNQELSLYKSNFLTMQYNEELEWIEADWIGYQNFETVKHGCMVMLGMLKKNNCAQVLNDNTHVTGNWSEASDWGAEFWFPTMIEAGLRQFAWIHSPSAFSRLAADKSVDTETNATARFFNNRNDAENWLLSMKENKGM